MLSHPFESERLLLRDITESDASFVYALWSNPENDKYMGDPVGSVDEVIAICRDKASDENYLKVATLKNTGEIVGTCCFGPTSNPNEWGFGYSIYKSFWGKGFATEIVQAIISYGQRMDIADFISDCAIENTASARVMEKCGMKVAYKSSFLQPKTNIEYVSCVYRYHTQ